MDTVAAFGEATKLVIADGGIATTMTATAGDLVFVPPGVRVRPIALFLAVAVMILMLVYAAVNRSYQVSPNVPAKHSVR